MATPAVRKAGESSLVPNRQLKFEVRIVMKVGEQYECQSANAIMILYSKQHITQ